MTAISETRITQQKEPLFGQFDLRYIREAAARTLLGRKLADRLDRPISMGDLQVLAACETLCAVIRGDFGEVVEDGENRPNGDLRTRGVPGLPTSSK